MNAIYETFSEHSKTGPHDIAFLTISDISIQIGISKSKLYKDIREGKLIAEKSLDDTLVVSPKALQDAYTDMDINRLFETDFPTPDCLSSLGETIGTGDLEDTHEEPPTFDKAPKNKPRLIEKTTIEQADVSTPSTPALSEYTPKTDIGKQNASQKAKIIGLCGAVIFCSAILIGVFHNF
jgi:hypothetical protein